MHTHREYQPSDQITLPRVLRRMPVALQRTLAIVIAVFLAMTFNVSTAWAEASDPEPSVAVSVEPPPSDDPPPPPPPADDPAPPPADDPPPPPADDAPPPDDTTPPEDDGTELPPDDGELSSPPEDEPGSSEASGAQDDELALTQTLEDSEEDDPGLLLAPAMAELGSGVVEPDLSGFHMNQDTLIAGSDVSLSVMVQEAALEGYTSYISGLTAGDFVVQATAPGRPAISFEFIREMASEYFFFATPLLAGDYTVSVTVNGVTLTQTASLTVRAGQACSYACSPVDPNNVTMAYVTNDGQWADGRSAVTVVVNAFDRFGNPVSDAYVKFLNVSPGGLISGLDPANAAVLSGSDGTARQAFTANQPGAYRVMVEADDYDVNLVILTFVDPPEYPTNVSLELPATAVAGQTVTATIQATGASSQPVTVPIGLTESTGNVTFMSNCVLDASSCTVDLVATQAGTYTVEVTVDGVVFPDVSASVTYSAGPLWLGMCGVQGRCSTAEVTTDGAIADGRDANVVTMWAYDRYGNPVAGVAVDVVGYQPWLTMGTFIRYTDANGRADFQVTTHQTGPAKLTMRYMGPSVYTSADMVFVPGPIDSVWIGTATGTLQAGDITSVAVDATDAFGNAAVGATVGVREATGNVTFPDGATCVIEYWGGCQIGVQSFTAGVFTIEALVDDEPVGISTDVTFTAGPVWFGECEVDADRCTRIEVTKNGATANGTAANVVSAWAYDRYGNPVEDAWYTVERMSNGLTVAEAVVQPDADGRADFLFTSTTIGDAWAYVSFWYEVEIGLAEMVFTAELKAPVVTSPADGALTNARPVVVTGTGQPGASVVVSDATRGVFNQAVVAKNGTWSLPLTLTDGTYQLSAVQIDEWGNKSPSSSVVKLTVDTVAPGAPRIDRLDRTGVYGGPGAAEPGATITVLWPDGTTSTTIVTADGSWFAPLPAGMISGDVGAYATDAAGNISELTDPWLDVDEPAGGVSQEAAGTLERDAGLGGSWTAEPEIDEPALPVDDWEVPVVRPDDPDVRLPVPAPSVDAGTAPRLWGPIVLAAIVVAIAVLAWANVAVSRARR